MTKLDVPRGVQSFNLWAAWIAARLWEEFPHPQFFSVHRDGVHVSRDFRVLGESFGPTDRESVEDFAPSMNWLISEHYLRSGRSGPLDGHFPLVELTERGFSILSEVPTSIASEEGSTKPLGTRMSEAVVSQAPQLVLSQLIKSLFGHASK